MEPRPSSRSSRRASPVRASKNLRHEDRASARGRVWVSAHDRLVAAGELVDLSETGLRYIHDPATTGADGFPVGVPQAGQPILIAVTMRSAEQPKAVGATVVRVEPLRDGRIEVACHFEAKDAQEQKLLHKKYVEANLQRARQSLTELRARLLNDATPVRRQRQPLGRVLLKNKALDKSDLDDFLSANRNGVRLGSGLVKAGLVSSRQLAEALAEHLGLPFVDLDLSGVNAEALKLLPKSDCAKRGLVPFDVSGRTLRVAVNHPLTMAEKNHLEGLSRYKLKVYLADLAQIQEVLEGEAPRRSKPRVPSAVLARYRFYGSALQQLDSRTFEGAVANVSETGILLSGPAPADLLAAYEAGETPRVYLAAQLFHGTDVEPLVLRFEPMRLAPIPPAEDGAPHGGFRDAPLCWIGARISTLVGEDRKHLVKLYGSLRAESR